MAKLFIFTSGTSMVTNLKDDANAHPILNYLRKWFETITIKKILDTPSVNKQAYQYILEYYNGKTGSKTTAEISSYEKLGVRKEDLVVILTSDTKEGVFAGLVNAHLMASKAKTPVVLWDRPGNIIGTFNWNSLLEGYEPGANQDEYPPVYLMIIKDLDPEKKEGFEDQAVGNLVYAIARLVKHANGHTLKPKPIIVFTGGFKVSLPVLTQAASWLGGIPMYGVHQESNKLIEIPVLATDIDPEVRNSILGWAWKNNRNRDLIERNEELDLNNWAGKTDKTWEWLRKEHKLVPVFTECGSGVKISILGEAILSVLIAKYD